MTNPKESYARHFLFGVLVILHLAGACLLCRNEGIPTFTSLIVGLRKESLGMVGFGLSILLKDIMAKSKNFFGDHEAVLKMALTIETFNSFLGVLIGIFTFIVSTRDIFAQSDMKKERRCGRD
jgi:hypothetical protein